MIKDLHDWLRNYRVVFMRMAMHWLEARGDSMKSAQYFYSHGDFTIDLPPGKRLAIIVQLEDDPNADLLEASE